MATLESDGGGERKGSYGEPPTPRGCRRWRGLARRALEQLPPSSRHRGSPSLERRRADHASRDGTALPRVIYTHRVRVFAMP